MARRGQNGWICTRESIVVSERGGFVHVGWNAAYNCRLWCRHNWPHCRHQRVTSAICHIGSQAAAADVAGPRPREVGGACRIQVLAAARTQETVGGPNGAKRSEFRRGCRAVHGFDVSQHLISRPPQPCHCPFSSSHLSVSGRRFWRRLNRADRRFYNVRRIDCEIIV